MKIQQIQPAPAHRSLVRYTSYIDINGIKRFSQNSTCARLDLNYTELAKIIKERFKHFKKINILPMNGSDGTEAYLIANAIINTFGLKEAKKKVFPIEVTDIDPYIIESFGKKGIIALEPCDEKLFGENLNVFFEKTDKTELPVGPIYPVQDYNAYKLKPEFKNLFTFKVMDLQ